MKKFGFLFLKSFLIIIIATKFSFATKTSLKADYQFNNSFQSSVGDVLDLIALGATNFENANVDGITTTVLTFKKGTGLSLVNCSQVILKHVYSIVVLFSFDDINGFKRIIDYKYRKSHSGLYTYGRNLRFHNIQAGKGKQVKAKKFMQVVITRDAYKNVNCYIDKSKEISFVDSKGLAVISNDDVLSFFKDKGNNQTSGAVARIRLYNKPLTYSQIALLDRLPTNTEMSGCVSLIDATKNAKVMLLQSGEMHQTVLLDEKGCYNFNSFNSTKPFTIIIRGKNDGGHILSQ